jgi:hypothetical protein
MNVTGRLRMLCVLAMVLGLCRNSAGAEYKVEFSKQGEGSEVVDIVEDELEPTPWHTVNDAEGVNLRNAAGFPVMSIRIKARRRGISFLVLKDAGGTVFKHVWKRKDNKEVVFLDGGRNFEAGSIIYQWVDCLDGCDF